MVDKALVDRYAGGFWGYGRWNFPYWFVGMEEGSDERPNELEIRLNAWNKRGAHTLEDLGDYHNAIGVERYFVEGAELQTTWGQLIRTLLTAQGLPTSKRDLVAYQRNRLGRWEGETCLIELLPFPKKGLVQMSALATLGLNHLTTPTKYWNYFTPKRIDYLRQRITEYEPRFVIFYGTTFRKYWSRIAEVTFADIVGLKCGIGKSKGTTFLMIDHPANYIHDKNRYFELIGEIIRKQNV